MKALAQDLARKSAGSYTPNALYQYDPTKAKVTDEVEVREVDSTWEPQGMYRYEDGKAVKVVDKVEARQASTTWTPPGMLRYQEGKEEAQDQA